MSPTKNTGGAETRSQPEKVRAILERKIKAVSLRPSIGQNIATTKVSVRDGLTCEVKEGDWKLTVDLNAKNGGNDKGQSGRIL